MFALLYKKERAASKFPFAELEENEEDLAKPEAWYAKVRARDRSDASLAERPGGGALPAESAWPVVGAREVGQMNVGACKLAARRLKEETYALYLAYGGPRTPWYARVFVALLVGYVFSPIDPNPDFIPVVGLLDEMVVVPLGVILARKLIPGEVPAERRERTRDLMRKGKEPVSRVVVAVWLLLTTLGAFLTFRVARELGVET